jgi:hypothetical protein
MATRNSPRRLLPLLARAALAAPRAAPIRPWQRGSPMRSENSHIAMDRVKRMFGSEAPPARAGGTAARGGTP